MDNLIDALTVIVVIICCLALGWVLTQECLARTEKLINVLTHEKNRPGKGVR